MSMEKSGDEHGKKAEIKSGQINEKSGIPLKNGDFTGLLYISSQEDIWL